MAYSPVPLVMAGDWIDEVFINTYWRDNMAASWPFTTTGDMEYAASGSTLSRLGIGALGTLLRSTGSAPAWFAKGTGGQHLRVNAGATDIEWASTGLTLFSTPKLATAWDGDAKTVGQTTVAITDFDATLPADVTGLLITLMSTWAAANAASGVNVTQDYAWRCINAVASVANYPMVAMGIVPVVSGNIKVEVSNANTLSTYLNVWGYIR